MKVIEKIKENHILLLVLLFINTYLITVYMRNPLTLPGENYCYFLLSYRYAIMPRALIGTIYDWLRDYGVGWRGLTLCRALFLFAIYNVAATSAYMLIRRFQEKNAALFFAVFVFALPSTFHHANMRESFDLYTSSAMLLATICIFKRKLFFLVPILVALGIMAHENMLFMYVPFLIGVIWWHDGPTKPIAWLKAASIVLAALITFGVIFHGRAKISTDDDAYRELNQYINAKVEFPQLVGKIQVNTYEMTYWEHCKSVWAHFFCEKYSLQQLGANVFSFILLLPAFYVLFRLWRNAYSQIKERRETIPGFLLLLASCFGGCFLFIIAFDYIRWFSAILICNVFALTLLYSDVSLGLRMNLSRRQSCCWALVIFFYLLMDPPGATSLPIGEFLSFPLYRICM